MSWDIFISHASEDKDEVARPLAEMLQQNGLDVWYDEFTLRIGDDLRDRIDHGLSQSRYGVVILSPSFFAKKWTKDELGGLFTLETAEKKRILPVWHRVSAADVKSFSPMLAQRLGTPTGKGLDQVASEVTRRVCIYQVRDHHKRTSEIDVSRCERHGSPGIPAWLAVEPARLGSAWLVERLSARADLRLYHKPDWHSGTWFVVDVQGEVGEVINCEQLAELRKSSATTTTTQDVNHAAAPELRTATQSRLPFDEGEES